MDLQLNSKLLQNFEYNNLVEYLELTGWQLSPASNTKWMVFEGEKDFYGQPLEIVLPQNVQASDTKQYLANAVNMLSALKETDPEIVAHNIQFYNRDILRIRNLETGENSSISIYLASQQIPQLKSLIAYSACSEVDPVPSHIDSQKPIAQSMTKHYQFGHTFRGSFGYTVECPITEDLLSRTRFFNQQVIHRPMERRVMERIVRGLLYTKEATEARNPQIIVDNYGDGLNANMCKALLKMSPQRSDSIEYSITWSPKLEPIEEIRQPGSILLIEPSYSHLDYAAKILEKLEPKEINIRGFVKELKTDDNPLGTDTSRTVVIDVTNTSNEIPSRVTVSLEKADYQEAIIAHGDWLPIHITGTLQRRQGNKWHIVKYSSFNVTKRLL